MKAAEKKLAEF